MTMLPTAIALATKLELCITDNADGDLRAAGAELRRQASLIDRLLPAMKALLNERSPMAQLSDACQAANDLIREAEQGGWQYLKPYGYAPGNYMGKCHRCDKIVTDIDKRAVTCRPCAEEAYSEQSSDTWQPIETAPDKKHVLVTGEFDRPGDWRIKIGSRNPYSDTGWQIYGASWTPTRWMPLPPPPKSKS